MNIALWIINVLLGILFIFAGQMKLHPTPEMVQGFTGMGYSAGFIMFIGVCEVLGGIGALIPRTRFWATTLLIPIMIGATYTHLSTHTMDKGVAAPVALVLLCISSWGRRDERGRIFAKGGLFTGV